MLFQLLSEYLTKQVVYLFHFSPCQAMKVPWTKSTKQVSFSPHCWPHDSWAPGWFLPSFWLWGCPAAEPAQPGKCNSTQGSVCGILELEFLSGELGPKVLLDSHLWPSWPALSSASSGLVTHSVTWFLYGCYIDTLNPVLTSSDLQGVQAIRNYKFCIVLLSDCTLLMLPLEVLCHTNHKFCAMLIRTSCWENFDCNYSLVLSLFCQRSLK